MRIARYRGVVLILSVLLYAVGAQAQEIPRAHPPAEVICEGRKTPQAIADAASGYSESVQYTFCSVSDPLCLDGVAPKAGFIQDTAGNLYSTTSGGGANIRKGFGGCTVFKVDTSGNETLLSTWYRNNGPFTAALH